MAKKVIVKRVRPQIKCAHCDLIVDFPVDYCTICKMHCHTLTMGNHSGGRMLRGKPNDVCADCWVGTTPHGQAWLRSRHAWTTSKGGNSNTWDSPEWYDMTLELECMTISNLWSDA